MSRKALFYIGNYQLNEAEKILDSVRNPQEKKLLKWDILVLKKGSLEKFEFQNNNYGTSFANILSLLIKGDQYLLQNIPKDSLAYNKYQEALQLSLIQRDSTLVCFSTKKIIELLYKNRKAMQLFSEYFKIYQKHMRFNGEKATLKFYKTTVNTSATQKEHIKAYKDIISIAKKGKNRFIEGKIYMHIGANFAYFHKQSDSALHYYQKALRIFKDTPHNYAKVEMFGVNTNIGISYSIKKKHETAKSYYLKAAKIKLPKNSFLKLSKLSSLLSKNYRNLKKYDSAFFYNDRFIKYTDSLNEYKKAIALNEIEVKYQTAEKEKKIVQLLNTNLKSEASRIQNRNLLIGSLSLILVGSIFVFLLYKNTKRKQRIAEQEREIEIQKTEKLLKEQELSAIDAMISGQEKERQRLANELHDNLGSTLATVKLHFQHLQNNKDNPKVEHIEELYTKTNALLDEAYQKVRTIAHEKNSGVMANQGLLPAIKKLAKQVSNGDGLHIEIQDYGLEERLDNALEISIFRMIQELITNAIKHAKASEIHISLTNHDSLLNIIIEDNGKGFDAKILPKKEGMGLRNIEKRVEHLEGTFEIDSTIGKGTNIIINIPI
ncbi:sensor histidine kinase [Aquimarina atlantica]|uniref:sensor histidine kinase n=1 Tax=Aquimarina atlantica TaxID=1317122 RepID=UPI0013F403C7|nr:sensor histidine kinase [Aquimarina atlantica]